MEKKRIAHVFWGLTFGGIETMLVNIANAQAEQGADVYVFIVNDMVEQTLLKAFSAKVKVTLLKRKVGSRNPLPFWRLNMKLLSVNPDAIHIHRSELFGALWFRRLSRVSSSTIHALPSGTVRRKSVLQKVFSRNHCDVGGNVVLLDKVPRVFSISNAVRDMLLERYGIDSIVVNNGILTSHFQRRDRDNWNVPFRIVQVSRLEHEKKGQDLLIEAAAKMKGLIDVTFIGDGSSMEFLKNHAKAYGVEDCVHFLGKKTQNYIFEHLKDYDLFVQASRWEGFGLTVAEAMAAKVPVLVSEGQGPAEVTCGDKYGWLFKNGDADDLAAQILKIMNEKDEVMQKTAAGLQYVRETYDVCVTARNYLKNYIYRK